MNTTNDLDRLDWTTLRVWRVSNLLAWGAVSAFAGYVANWIALNAASATANRIGGGQAGQAVVALLYTAAVGAAIGWMVGAHVYRSAEVVAGVAAFLATLFFPEMGMLFRSFVVGLVGSLLVEIGSAVFVARWAWRRRPAALRGG